MVPPIFPAPDVFRRRQCPVGSRALALRLALAAGAILLIPWVVAGRPMTPIPQTYTAEELQAKCVRTGGWWLANLVEGYCEFQWPMP